MKTLREKFESLKADKQWEWVVKNPDKIQMITLDNDSTSIMFKGDEDEDERYTHFRSDIGNRIGVTHLLDALKIPNEYC